MGSLSWNDASILSVSYFIFSPNRVHQLTHSSNDAQALSQMNRNDEFTHQYHSEEIVGGQYAGSAL